MKIGETTFTRGIEITIMTPPYQLHGAMWQDGVDEDGKVYTVMTEVQRQANIEKIRLEREEQQSAFARLKVLQKKFAPTDSR